MPAVNGRAHSDSSAPEPRTAGVPIRSTDRNRVGIFTYGARAWGFACEHTHTPSCVCMSVGPSTPARCSMEDPRCGCGCPMLGVWAERCWCCSLPLPCRWWTGLHAMCIVVGARLFRVCVKGGFEVWPLVVGRWSLVGTRERALVRSGAARAQRDICQEMRCDAV